MRIMIISNAEWAGTGYGMQTAALAPGLESLGHEVAVFPFWGLQGGMMKYKGRIQYPIWGNEWGNDAFMHHAAHFRADVVISLMDTWVMHDEYGKFCKWLPWTPIDHQPVPQKIVEHLRTATRVIAFSKFGQAELKKVGINADYIPHGVDVNIYRPLTLPDGRVPKEQFKMELGFPPNCFLVGMVAANKGYPSRKCFPENFEAFADFVKKCPDARLYCHSEPTSRYGGPDLQGMARDYGIAELVRFPNPYLLNLGFSQEVMCRIYNAMDVLLAPSMGEGFGVPCYLPDTGIIVNEGIKPIKDLTTQDMVVSHTGCARDITKIMKRVVINEPIVTFKIIGNGREIRVTKNHPILAMKRSGRKFKTIRACNCKPRWIAAGELTKEDFIFVPARKLAIRQRQLIDLGQYTACDGNYLNSKYSNHGGKTVNARHIAELAGVSIHTAQRALGNYEYEHVSDYNVDKVKQISEYLKWQPLKRISRYMPLNEDSGFLFGQYLSEGSIGRNGQIEFASHVKETEIRENLKRIIFSLWGLEGHEYIRGNSASFSFACKPVAEMFKNTCGNHSHRKHLPEFIWDNQDFARGVLKGMWLGDGCIKTQSSYSTASEQLAYGNLQLCTVFGFLPGISQDTKNIWNLRINGTQANDFLKLFGKNGRPRVLRQRIIKIDDGWLVPIREIQTKHYTGFVHNLEVDKDESYCAENVASHNCLEAESCGIPIIVTNFASSIELCAAGWLVDISRKWWTPLNSWQALPNIDLISDALQKAHEADRIELGKKAREFAMDYRWEKLLVEGWKPLLEKVEPLVYQHVK